MRKHFVWISVPLSLVAIAGTALAQPADPPAPVPEQDAGLLGGPKVDPGTTRPADLGLMNFDGTMQRAEAPVAELALETLTLDDATRAKVDSILLARASAIDAYVTSNMQVLPELQAARQSGDGEKLRSMMRSTYEALKPTLDKGRLEDQIAAVLPVDQAESYRKVIADHRLKAEEARLRNTEGRDLAQGDAPGANPRFERLRRRMAERGGVGGGQAGQMDEMREIVMVEIPRSYQRIISTQKSNLDSLVAELNLDEETTERVRRVFREAAANGSENINRAQLLRDVAAELTPEQRQAFRRLMAQRRGQAGGAAPARPTPPAP